MKTVTRVALAVLWPPSAPAGGQSGRVGVWWWGAVCALSTIPIAAIVHNRVFWPRTCMLAPFDENFSLAVMKAWLWADPSLLCAMALATLIWARGMVYRQIKYLVAPFFVSFLPLSVWLWDIPFTGKIICTSFHDGQVKLAPGVALSTVHFYGLGALLYVVFLAARRRNQPVPGRADLQPCTERVPGKSP